MVRKLLVLSVLLLSSCLTLAAGASGHATSSAQAKVSKLHQVIEYQKEVIQQDRTRLKRDPLWATIADPIVVDDTKVFISLVVPHPVREMHKQHLSVYANRLEASLKRLSKLRRLLVQNPYAGLPPHAQGWLCIHNLEGAWNAQTGNGYYGGLQMTYGWMGLVQNAALMSPSAQMWAAETGLKANGYSSSWLAGQWPNTYPPCAGYF
jgi:hypothetical protein